MVITYFSRCFKEAIQVGIWWVTDLALFWLFPSTVILILQLSTCFKKVFEAKNLQYTKIRMVTTHFEGLILNVGKKNHNQLILMQCL